MKVAILGFTKVKYMPYMYFYLDQIDRTKDEVHLVYWKRDDNPDAELPDGVIGHALEYPMSDAVPLRKKLPGIAKYGSFAKKTLKKINPDFLIVLHSTTAISIKGLLKRKYKGRYIFDYRDVTYEHISLYRNMVKKIVNNSVLSFTSSDGFRKYLPETPKLLTSHNLSNVSFREEVLQNRTLRKQSPIRISFWGMLRNQKVNEDLIRAIGDDKRFELHYYGRAQGNMLNLMEESARKYSNVFYHGEYAPKDRLDMAKNTDLLHNLYNNTDKTSHIAMGNKYYDGLLFSLPQLCTKQSLMGQLCSRCGIGIECDPSDNDFPDQIYAYYTSISEKDFFHACDQEFERVLEEYNFGTQKIKEVLKNG